jgi:glycosyltransferase involved in cell wall biosynthesis
LNQFAPTHILFVETPFNENILTMARERGIKTIGISMHETGSLTRLDADLYICPSYCAWEKSRSDRNALLFLPIGIEMFPFKKRTGHTFLMNIGYGGPHDRRQADSVIKAFCSLTDPDARMIVNSQVNFPGRIDDPRIEYRLQNFPNPADCYADGDIYLGAVAYDGYGRPVLESMACGLPCVTTNADPMNLFQHDPDFLIEPTRTFKLTSSWVHDTTYNAIDPPDFKAKMEFLLTIDTAKYSERSRAQAEAQSWESGLYKDVWLETIASA